MSNAIWHKALKHINPFVFKIITPEGHGTGFQVYLAKNSTLCGVATALHVVDHAYEWEEPIKVFHFESGEQLLLKGDDRAIFTIPEDDLAIILFSRKDLPLNNGAVDLIEKEKTVKQGADLGWCGFPAVQPDALSFFAGHISCCLKGSYLVDGVAINGVSGGPAFYMRTPSSKKPTICGVITAYRPNFATGNPLPGVSLVRSVKSYLPAIEKFRSLDQAKEEADKEITEEGRNIKKEQELKKTKKNTIKKKSVKKSPGKKIGKEKKQKNP